MNQLLDDLGKYNFEDISIYKKIGLIYDLINKLNDYEKVLLSQLNQYR